MAMSDHIILFIMLLLCGVVMPCYFNRATAAAGVDETSIGVNKKVMCIDHERDALLQFKQHVTQDYCGLLTSWGRHEDCCQWRGIRCSNLTGHVTMLHLGGGGINCTRDLSDGTVYCSCLEGKVISPLFELRHLKYLDLSCNSFESTIPKSIDSLTNLKHLNLSHNFFYGEIPPQLGNISTLASLDLSDNMNYLLTSKSLHWLSSLTSLREISLHGSNLSEATDWSETINKIHSLRVLYLDECYLPPIIPSSLSYINSSSIIRVVSLSSNNFNDTSLFQWLFNLSSIGCQFEYLDLSENYLSGPLPSAFGNIHSLKYLDLSWNSLSGPLPSAFGNLHSLKYLDLSWNSLSGPIPDIFSNMRSLRVLSISNTTFHGSIPKNLGNLCHLKKVYLRSNNLSDDLSNVIETLSCGCSKNKSVLETLDLGQNHFWGSVPDKITKFSLLREIYLDANELNGTISEGIWKLLMLETLDISENFLKASLNHNHFSNVPRLRGLYLGDNPALMINISADWIPPFQLESLTLRSTKSGPTFPEWILTQTNLTILDISNSQLSGYIPQAFWVKLVESPNMWYLNVSYNKFHGVLSNLSTSFVNDSMFLDATNRLCPKSYSMLYILDLSNNLFSGELPYCWMQFVNLLSLHLENNQLFGNIPKSIGTMKQLGYLHLENNQFFGNIPKFIGSLEQLRYLHLENNSFSGEIPVSLGNCTHLVILDLSYNSLTGHVPSSLGNVLELRILNLRRNNFLGNLPDSLCQLPNLQILDLAFNNISGIIPNCIHNLTAMTKDHKEDPFEPYHVLEVDQEAYSVEESANTIEWKTEEREFGLSSLNLVKMIDLSCNELEGNIPNGISSLTGLISLDLSSNKLSGSIATDIGQLASLELLNLSNNHLVGSIPTSLAQVSTLEILDLSNNNLSGRIPLGTQLQGFDPSFYGGNPFLCGMPLQGCSGDKPPAFTTTNGENSTQHEHNKDDDIYLGLYISVVLGFIVGFWGVCGTLVLRRSWRHAFFQFIDDVKDKLHVMVVVTVARIWRKT